MLINYEPGKTWVIRKVYQDFVDLRDKVVSLPFSSSLVLPLPKSSSSVLSSLTQLRSLLTDAQKEIKNFKLPYDDSFSLSASLGPLFREALLLFFLCFLPSLPPPQPLILSSLQLSSSFAPSRSISPSSSEALPPRIFRSSATS